MEELLARVRVAVRRRASNPDEPLLVAGPVCLDLSTREVTAGGIPVHLTPTEFDLLRLLLEQEGRVLTQRFILERVWGPQYVDDSHILRTFIHQLRQKLSNAASGAGDFIATDPGVGYRLVVATTNPGANVGRATESGSAFQVASEESGASRREPEPPRVSGAVAPLDGGQ
jgi:two-component system, OmpR family, KDP operon response regulator KdpE